MNIIRKVTKSLNALALAALVLAPAAASADSLNKEGEFTKTVSIKKGHARTFWVKDVREDQMLSLDVEITYKYTVLPSF